MADLDQRKVDELLASTRENNKMLHKLVSAARWARVGRFIYYAFIIGSAVGAYYYLQPFVEAFQKALSDPHATSQQFSEDIFKQFQAQAEKYIKDHSGQ